MNSPGADKPGRAKPKPRAPAPAPTPPPQSPPSRTSREASRPAEVLDRQGVPVSDGLSAGPAYLILPAELPTEERRVPKGEEAHEVRRFRLAVRRSRDELHALRECLVGDTDETGLRILDAHSRLLEDPELLAAVLSLIRVDRLAAESALYQVFQKMIQALEAAGLEYFRARSADIRDVKRRILRHLDEAGGERASIPSGVILVAPELAPSESTVLDPERVLGLITDHGGATSHAAILARSRGIPAVAGLVDLSHHVSNGDWILLDGHTGRVVVRPGAAERQSFEARRRVWQRRHAALARQETRPCVTRDGHPIRLLANIESPADIEHVLASGADGIGLYRTEYFFLASTHLPDEEGQCRAYRQVLRRLGRRPVTIRTLDVGGDKFASYLGTSRTDNPFLGLRGIRFLLLHQDILRTQLRAILRAAGHGEVRILFPMISSVEEVREVNHILDEVEQDLRREGHELTAKIERGVMIETPSAVTLADHLAREVDFFSIGSNDLIQYTLAVDRGDEKVAHLYDPFHPAVLRALAQTIEAGARGGIRVTSCGEMSGDLYGAALLVGLGCASLSMSPPRIAEVKALLRRLFLSELREWAADALRQPTGAEVRAVLRAGLEAYVGGCEPTGPPSPRAGILESIDPPPTPRASRRNA